MGNHFHLLVRMHTADEYTDDEIKQRYIDYYRKEAHFADGKIDYYRKKWSNLSEFVKDINHSSKNIYGTHFKTQSQREKGCTNDKPRL